MNDFANQEENSAERQGLLEDFEVEFSDLPPDRDSHYLLLRLVALKKRLLAALPGFKPGESIDQAASATSPNAHLAGRVRAGRRTRASQALTALGLCAALCILLIGNVPALRTRFVGLFQPPTPTPAPQMASALNFTSARSFIIIRDGPGNRPRQFPSQGTIGPLPPSCPKANSLQEFNAPLDPPGVGGGPLWLLGFAGPTAAMVHVQKAPLPGLGWYETVVIFVQKGEAEPIVLNGGNQLSNMSLAFSEPGSTNTSTSVTLSLDTPNGGQFSPHGSWETTQINIYVPVAGCYYLRAFWQTDSWMVYFAAGS